MDLRAMENCDSDARSDMRWLEAPLCVCEFGVEVGSGKRWRCVGVAVGRLVRKVCDCPAVSGGTIAADGWWAGLGLERWACWAD